MNYFEELSKLFTNLQIQDPLGRRLDLRSAIYKIYVLIRAQQKKGNKVIFIGNGGSASIASHIATDFIKNARIPALVFSDASLLTCLSNDLGYEHVFQKPIEVLAKRGDILFAISSSGKSKNILNAVKAAKAKGCLVISLSGFRQDNPLRKLGSINFYIPSFSYGFVEIAHLAICHSIVDYVISNGKSKWTNIK